VTSLKSLRAARTKNFRRTRPNINLTRAVVQNRNAESALAHSAKRDTRRIYLALELGRPQHTVDDSTRSQLRLKTAVLKIYQPDVRIRSQSNEIGRVQLNLSSGSSGCL
jgi:hypothetical protein